MKSLEKFWAVIKAVGGFVVGATGVLGWLNVTPEMIGQTAYDMLRVSLPAVMFIGGALSGWGITSIYYKKKVDERGTELAETAAHVPELEKRLKEAEGKLAVYEDGDRRLQEKVEGMPRAFMLALGYAVERGDVFEVMGDSDLERELEEIESQYGFVKCRKVWGNCKEWVATEQGRRAWSLAGGHDLYDPSSKELTRIRMCVLGTRECAIATLNNLETQVLLYLYDVPGAKCTHATAVKVTDSLGLWAVETKAIDDDREIESCDLTGDARGIVEALVMDKAGKRLYKRIPGWEGEMFLDRLAENLDPGWERLGDL